MSVYSNCYEFNNMKKETIHKFMRDYQPPSFIANASSNSTPSASMSTQAVLYFPILADFFLGSHVAVGIFRSSIFRYSLKISFF